MIMEHPVIIWLSYLWMFGVCISPTSTKKHDFNWRALLHHEGGVDSVHQEGSSPGLLTQTGRWAKLPLYYLFVRPFFEFWIFHNVINLQVEKCHYTYATEFRPTQVSFIININVIHRFIDCFFILFNIEFTYCQICKYKSIRYFCHKLLTKNIWYSDDINCGNKEREVFLYCSRFIEKNRFYIRDLLYIFSYSLPESSNFSTGLLYSRVT